MGCLNPSAECVRREPAGPGRTGNKYRPAGEAGRSRRTPFAMPGRTGGPGTVEGPALVLRPGEEPPVVPEGSVLVCSRPETARIGLLPACRGLVCEEGGILNATATTARELGIPVVVEAVRATRAIETGDRIRVDGDAGLVVLIRAE